ncbi:hypothetical protein [Kutzneria kofuensis]
MSETAGVPSASRGCATTNLGVVLRCIADGDASPGPRWRRRPD